MHAGLMCERSGRTGKLIRQLGVGEDWDDVCEILRQELRENVHMSSEQRVIRASLAGLQGTERDKTGINNLFKLFGLVPPLGQEQSYGT
jgi:hypothetical protein